VTPDQVLIGAIVVVVVILVIVGIGRAATRRRGANEDAFGAGGVSQVAVGTTGVTKTALTPEGVVLAAGEQWTASSASGTRIDAGQRVRVVGQKGLILLVEAVVGSATSTGAATPMPPAPPSSPTA
jgi:membrane protein implicated in regulation of membrane protease activity